MDNSGIIGPTTSGLHLDSSAGSGLTDYAFTDFQTIAHGTYSSIVRARRHNQWWALKCLRKDLVTRHFFRQMLQKEYDLLVRMHHSGIDRPISIEDVEGLGPCLVMECIEGVTLDAFHTDREGRRRIAFQIVDTMAYVHSCQVVHRDLKPSNIMVTHNGQNVKIIDFGLADADNYAVLKQPAGTPRYISPEQLTSHSLDVRNDVYSLGVILGDLRLGWPYRHIVRRCTGPIHRRYMGAGELLRAMQRAARLPLWTTLAAIVVVTTIIFAAMSHTPSKDEVTVPSAREVAGVAPAREARGDTTGAQPPSNDVVTVLPARGTKGGAPARGSGGDALAAAYDAGTKRVDQYLCDHQYAELLSTLQNEPAPSAPYYRDPRYKELLAQYTGLLDGLWAELEQMRTEATPSLGARDAEVLYKTVADYAMNNYSTKLGNAFIQYANRNP